jgi:hypothetical protein
MMMDTDLGASHASGARSLPTAIATPVRWKLSPPARFEWRTIFDDGQRRAQASGFAAVERVLAAKHLNVETRQ